MARLQVCRRYDQLPSIKKLVKTHAVTNGKDKSSNPKKEPEVSNKHVDSAEKSQGFEMNKGSQLNKESGVSNNKESGISNEQGVPAEQGVRGLK